MNIKEQHLDFKIKLNKIDSEQYRNLLVPEIDWLLNRATDLFIKITVFPRYNPIPGFEKTKRDTEDIKTLVVDNFVLKNPNVENNIYTFDLPEDYLYYVSSEAEIENNKCGIKKGRIIIRQHDDDFQNSPFDRSSYEWKIINAVFNENGIAVYSDNNFTVNKLFLNYIKKFPYIHNAEDFYNNTYTDLNGNVLTGTQDCILPEHTHSEIVDIAVLLATQNLQIPDYQIKLNKLKLN